MHVYVVLSVRYNSLYLLGVMSPQLPPKGPAVCLVSNTVLIRIVANMYIPKLETDAYVNAVGNGRYALVPSDAGSELLRTSTVAFDAAD